MPAMIRASRPMPHATTNTSSAVGVRARRSAPRRTLPRSTTRSTAVGKARTTAAGPPTRRPRARTLPVPRGHDRRAGRRSRRGPAAACRTLPSPPATATSGGSRPRPPGERVPGRLDRSRPRRSASRPVRVATARTSAARQRTPRLRVVQPRGRRVEDDEGGRRRDWGCHRLGCYRGTQTTRAGG